MEKNKTHPCFSESGHLKYARMHLPVAPECNIQCNYCNRKFDCLNESRPGVTSEILTPQQAFEKFVLVKQKISDLSVIGFAGPGDALENFDKIKETVALIKQNDPDIIFCLSTNGLRLPEFAQEIIDIGITHITVTINAVDVEIGKLIYSGVNSEFLLKNQLEGLEYITKRGIVCKVNIVAIKGINDFHIEEVVKTAKKLGAFKTNIMPLIPAKETKFYDLPLMSSMELNELRKKCSVYLPQMYHCRQCRADAVGLLHHDRSNEFISKN
ncbi:MAG TPA: nitrogenase cofactor biosynthesis protein NifB [Candidatus Gastranaerophilales bacterium]|nr:nitrogenase cofactor biosynthesis protein NifB [Candidatus Gastranaerophilales bacterium]